MQTVMRFSRCGAGFGNKKSPHNNLNLTIPSGMALVRVRYVAIRKSKTCSGSFGSRAGTLSKYVILNCWDRLPQKSRHVNVNLSGRGPSILLRKTVLSLKSPTGAFIAALRFANANLSGRGPSILLRKTVLSLKSPTGAFIAALRFANANLSGRGPSILLRKTVLSLKSPTGAFIAALRFANVNLSGRGPSILLTQDRSVA